MNDKLTEFFDNIIKNYHSIPIRVNYEGKYESMYLDELPIRQLLEWIKMFIESRGLDNEN